MCELENRMVDDAQWWWQNESHEAEDEEEKEKGYMEMTTKLFVSEEDAYDYAMERCLMGTEEEQKNFRDEFDDDEIERGLTGTEDEQEEFRSLIVEWFYSGNWVEVK